MKQKSFIYLVLILLSVVSGGTAISQSPTAVAGALFVDSGQALGSEWSNDVALGDLDGDTDLDAFVANSQNLQVWLNQGGEQGGTPGLYADSGQLLGDIANQAVALGDVDGDTDLDAYVIRGGSVDSHQIWINQGGEQGGTPGTFLQTAHNVSDNQSTDIILGDVDGDNDLDAYITRNFSSDLLYLNDGVGNFADSGRVLDGGNNWGADLADLDGDNDLDIFVARDGGNTVWINQGGAQGNIPGTYLDTGQQLGDRTSLDVKLADVDGDGDNDAFVANGIGNKVWINRGGAQGGNPGIFWDSGQSLGFTSTWEVGLADFDGDGDNDAFAANSEGNKVWLNQGGVQGGTAGNFADNGQELGEDFSRAVALGDVDGDSDVDAFVANSTPGANRVYLNFGAGASDVWQVQTVDVRGNVGQYADVAVDAMGRPHISYYEQKAITGRLKYAFWDGLSWQVTVVDESTDVGQYSAIALDNNGRPHISYIDGRNHRLKYARLTAAGWQVQTIPAGFANWHTDIAYDGRVHITFYGQNERLRHVEWDVTNWLFSDVAQSSVIATHSLALGADGRPHVSYYNGTELWYARQEGGTWVTGMVGETAVNGPYNALALDAGDQPHIAYIDPAAAEVGYVFFDGFTWDNFAGLDADPSLANSRYVAIGQDNSDAFQIAYYRNGRLNLFKQIAPTAWAFETIDSNRVGQHVSLAWDDQDRAHVVYYDDNFDDLKYANTEDAWQVRRVDTNGIDGNAAQALWQGVPDFAIQSAITSPSYLYLTRWQNGLWQLDPVEVVAALDNPMDFTYDELGNPHLAFYKGEKVYYASRDGSQWTSEMVYDLPAAAELSPSLVLVVANGQPKIVYGLYQGGFSYIELAEPDGMGGWARQALGFGSSWGEAPSVLAADVMAGGEVAVTYFWPMSAGAAMDTLALARWDGTQWLNSTVIQGVAVTAVSLAVDRRYSLNDTPEQIAIAFYDNNLSRLRYAVSTDESYAFWDIQSVALDISPVADLALTLAENVIHQPRLAYVDGADNSLYLLASEYASANNWTTTQLLPPGGAARSHLSFAFGDRERLAYLEGTETYHLFRTENRLVAPPDLGDDSVPIGDLQDGALCAFVLDTITFCDTFPGAFLCANFWPGLAGGNGRSPHHLSGTATLPGDAGVLANLTNLFQATPDGTAFVNEYAQHDAEIGTILSSDAGLLWDGYRTLQDFMPGLEALTQGQGDQVIITQDMVDNALAVWTQMAAAAGPELAGVINGRLAQHNDLQDFVGMSFDDWALAMGVNPPTNEVYLPFVQANN